MNEEGGGGPWPSSTVEIMTSNKSFNSIPDTDIVMDEQGNDSNSNFDHNVAAKRRLRDSSTQSSTNNSGGSDSEFSTTSTLKDEKMQIKENKASTKERRSSKKKKNEVANITYVIQGPVGKASTGGRITTQGIVPQRDLKARKASCTTVGANAAAAVEDPTKKAVMKPTLFYDSNNKGPYIVFARKLGSRETTKTMSLPNALCY